MSSDKSSRGFPGSFIEDGGDKEGTAGATRERSAEDISGLRPDVAKVRENLSNFVSEAGGHAAQVARNVGHTVASQMGSTASGIANTSSEFASSAAGQFRTVASGLEDLARKNPLGALAGALAVGVVIGLIVRGRG
jgi:ElaB/YqjD/DUF883 family membrane-anchored ribosome-binding protein